MQVLWIDLFTNVCSLFCFISLLESCVALSVAHHSPSTGLNILSYVQLATLVKTPAGWMHHDEEPALSAAAGILFERRRAGILVGRSLRDRDRRKHSLSPAAATGIIILHWRRHSKRCRLLKDLSIWERQSSLDMKKLLMFEAYFFEVDVESDGHLTMDEMRTFLSYAAMDQPIADRIEALRTISRRRSKDLLHVDEWGRARIKVTRSDFVRVCSTLLWNTSDDVIAAACKAYKNAVATAQNNSENYWANLSQSIDETSRLIIPGAFLICLFILFGIEFYDQYGADDFYREIPAPMQEGFMSAHPLKPWAIVCIFMVPVCILAFYFTVPRVKGFIADIRVRQGGTENCPQPHQLAVQLTARINLTLAFVTGPEAPCQGAGWAAQQRNPGRRQEICRA